MSKDRRYLLVGIIAVFLVLIGCIWWSQNYVYASSEAVSTTANCEASVSQNGDEVRVDISTKKMKISTFVASFKYDTDAWEYKGYEGADGTQEVNLTSEKTNLQIAVEQSEFGPYIGMYGIGVEEKKYDAANPLVTLIFKSKNGDATSDIEILEATDGKDGYMSPELEQQINPTNNEYGDNTSVDNQVTAHQKKNNKILIPFGIGLVVILATICVVIIRRKHRR